MTGQPARHDAPPLEPVAHEVVASWPPGTFLENIALRPGGGFVVSVHSRSELVGVDPDGRRSRLASMPGPPAGLVVDGEDVYVAVGEPGSGPHAVYRVGPDGQVRHHLDVPDTLFLNGFTPGRPGLAYAVDSFRGTVVEIDLAAATSRVVLRHELLGKISDEPMLPGVNGVKLGDGAAWLTNTDRALVLRAGLGDDGFDGSLDVVAEHLRGDDIALDTDGDLYVTTHIHNTLVRLGADGGRVALAGPDQAMYGSTACAFGAGPDRRALFVTTTGGIVLPVDDVPRPAVLVRLAVDRAGRLIP